MPLWSLDLQHLGLCGLPGRPGTEHVGSDSPQQGISKAQGFVKVTAKFVFCFFSL